jgi:hypothetical protein
MTTNYHTPIPTGASANADTFNSPLGEMDQALTEALLLERDGHIIQEEGSDLAAQARLDFVGAGVTVTNEVGKTKVTIPGGVTDHGALTGLGDDDHPQYLLASGLRAMDEQSSSPSSPSASKMLLYFKNDEKLYKKNSSGVETEIGGSGAKFVADGRLTLTSGTPVTITDVTGATTVYYSPFIGNQIGLYDGVSAWTTITFAELSLALGTVTSGLPYDIFIYNNAGTATMEKLAWTNSTTRATALTTQDGVLVKSGATTRRYIGTICASSTTATEDSQKKRYVWNYYNRMPRPFYFTDTTNSWAYTTTSWRQWNNSSSNQVDFVIGWSLEPVELSFVAVSYCTGIVNYTFAGIGLDRSTTDSDAKINGLMFAPADTSVAGTAIYQDYPGVGKHYLAAMEYGRTSATFVGDDGGTTVKTGVTGKIMG